MIAAIHDIRTIFDEMMRQHILQARLRGYLLHLALDIVQQNAQFLDELLRETLRLEHSHAWLRLCRLA